LEEFWGTTGIISSTNFDLLGEEGALKPESWPNNIERIVRLGDNHLEIYGTI
jgi:hypothetical protein